MYLTKNRVQSIRQIGRKRMNSSLGIFFKCETTTMMPQDEVPWYSGKKESNIFTFERI